MSLSLEASEAQGPRTVSRVQPLLEIDKRDDLDDVDMTSVMGSCAHDGADSTATVMRELIEAYRGSCDMAAYVKAVKQKKTYLNILDGAVAASILGVDLHDVEIVQTTGTQTSRQHWLHTLA